MDCSGISGPPNPGSAIVFGELLFVLFDIDGPDVNIVTLVLLGSRLEDQVGLVQVATGWGI